MIRAVLVGWSGRDWRLYRQPQWMAEVRRAPDAARLPRRHYDIQESAFEQALEAWVRDGAGAGEGPATDLLGRLGATEVGRPGGG